MFADCYPKTFTSFVCKTSRKYDVNKKGKTIYKIFTDIFYILRGNDSENNNTLNIEF